VSKRYAKDEAINIGRFLLDLGGTKSRPSTSPTIWRDPYAYGKLAYKSPLSQRQVDSREQRKAEMKEFNVREVDPSEGPHRDKSRFNNPDNAKKYGIRLDD
jgi:hypothetical protein